MVIIIQYIGYDEFQTPIYSVNCDYFGTSTDGAQQAEMIQFHNTMEKRLLMRYPAIDGVVVAVRPHAEILGYMIDVSLGGLSFRYVDSSLDEKPSSELTILVSAPRLCLDRIPYRTVADFELPPEYSFSSIRVRRRCVEFGQLNEQQRHAVEELILTCSHLNIRLHGNRRPTLPGRVQPQYAWSCSHRRIIS